MSLVVALLALLFAHGILAAQDDVGERIDAYVSERIESLGVPGAAVAVVQGGEIVHVAGYGVANEAGDPVTPQTPFLLASLSKSMTAVAVMQLVEEGKLDLDAPVQEILPWFMPESPITVRQLLNQTSGLDELQGYKRDLEADGEDALAASIRRLATAELNRPPGAAYEYSNSNYDVLGLLIQTVSGQSYGDYMQEHLFAPLAMTRSFASLDAAREAGMSEAFYPFFGRQMNLNQLMPYTRGTQPSAGMISSAQDLAHYMLAHLNAGQFRDHQLLSPAGIETLHAPAAAVNPNMDYGMGWALWKFEDIAPPGGEAPTALSHGGEWLGVYNLIVLVPEYDLGVAMLISGPGPTNGEALANVTFNTVLLALGLEPTLPPVPEDPFTRYIYPLSLGLILLMLILAVVAVRRLRRPVFGRRDALLFAGLAAFDLAVLGYSLFVRLPAVNSTLPLVLRFEPDLGLVLLVIVFLTAVWGTVRSLWAFRKWRASDQTAAIAQ